MDSRRFGGPEGAKGYHAYIKREKGEKKKNREDDRKPNEHRKLFMKMGVISQAKGSAYIEQGQTKIICGVYGPREIPRRSDFTMKGVLTCDFKQAPFASRNKRGGHQKDPEEKEISLILKEALESTVCLHMYPKSQIDVYITVLENDGSAIAASLTCAGLALVDASINTFDVIVGASIKRTGAISIVDPTWTEEPSDGSENSGCVTLGYLPSHEQIAALVHEGELDTDNLKAVIKELTDLCTEVQPNVNNCLMEAVRSKLPQGKDMETT